LLCDFSSILVTWGLRDYQTGKWEGGKAGCDHKQRHGSQGPTGQRADRAHPGEVPYKDVCGKCGAVRVDHQVGLERIHDCLGWATKAPCGGCYICHIVEVFRELRRVLRADATCWVNMGDSYATGGGKVGDGGGKQGARWAGFRGDHPHDSKRNPASIAVGPMTQPNRLPLPGLKPKDLCMMPARLALALQADGWYLRSDIVWAKPNPMPESVLDRPTKAHEYLFLLAKSARYFYDAEAIKEASSPDSHARYGRGRSDTHKWADGGPGNQTIAKTFEHMRRPAAGWHQGSRAEGSAPRDQREPGVNPKATANGSKQNPSFSASVIDLVGSRNKRTVWTFPTMATPEAHFATYPVELAETCILAGTSERGCCPTCGTPWLRETETSYENPGNRRTNGPRSAERKHKQFGTAGYAQRLERRTETTGWRPGCGCDAGAPVPCAVLDPFSGLATTGLAALKHGRRYVGIELSKEYVGMTLERVARICPLLTTAEATA
jgi:DNA modification methylase